MTSLSDMTAHRLFSLNLYKNLKLPLGEMSFANDFPSEKRGDLYPVIDRGGDFTEKVCGGIYSFSKHGFGAHVTRLIGRHFPYATYELTLLSLCGGCGLSFIAPCGRIDIVMSLKNEYITVSCSCGEETKLFKDTGLKFTCGMDFIITCRGKSFDIYFKNGGIAEYVCSFDAPCFEDICCEKVFSKTIAALCVAGEARLSAVSFYVDCGIAQADIRPVRYENGEIIFDSDGRIFLTASLRMQQEQIQGILSWLPGTADFKLTGALFYDAGDGVWGNDVAASMMYNRQTEKWQLWVCSFCHDHILGYSEFSGDVRFGVNVLDITLMPKMPDGFSDTEFFGKCGDEDPDFIFDREKNKWYLSVCRLTDIDGGKCREYRYFFFESDNPFGGYKYIGGTKSGCATGGSIINIDGEFVFVCGSSFDRRADYRIYRLFEPESFVNEKFDYDDGGFRGWGTIIPCRRGSRTKYYHLTFDRANASDYNWSYGNIYCFELSCD